MHGSLPNGYFKSGEANQGMSPDLESVIFRMAPILISLALLIAPLSSGEETGSIRKGNVDYETVLIEFGEGGGMDPSLSIPIPQGGPVMGASMEVSTVQGKRGPSEVSIDLGMDGRKEWIFGGGAEGHLGEQTYFASETNLKRMLQDGPSNSFRILLPQEAHIEDATVILNLPPSISSRNPENILNIDPRNISIEAVDIGDLDGDGIEELVYHYLPDSCMYLLDFDNSGNLTKKKIFSDASGDPALRILEGNTDGPGAVVIQYFDGGDSRERISLLKSISGGFEEIELAENLSRDAVGFQVLTDIDTGRDIVYVLKGEGGGISEYSMGESGSIIEQVIIDDSRGIIGLGSGDLSGSGHRDLILFPEKEDKNITILASSIINDASIDSGLIDLGVNHPINDIGTPMDLDGDGREEFYFSSGHYGDLAVISNKVSGHSLSWMGLNGTYSSPRSLPRSEYGDSGAYDGPEGFLYTFSLNGFFQILPSGEGGYLFDLRKDIPGPTLVGKLDDEGSGSLYSFTLNDGLTVSEAEWETVENLSFTSSIGRMDPVDIENSMKLNIQSLIGEQPSGKESTDEYGNPMTATEIFVNSDHGFITLSDLSIDYEVTLEISRSPFFMKALEKARKDFDGSFVPFMVEGGSAGSVEVGPVTVTYDSPPLIHDSIPDRITINEGSLGQTLIDVLDHVEDDLLEKQKLSVDIVPVSPMPAGLLFIDDHHLLVSHASRYPDVNGNFSFRIAVSDMNTRVLSDEVELVILPVQDPPVLKKGLGTIFLAEGEELTIPLTGDQGLFEDPDGDPMNFEISVVQTEPVELENYLNIGVEGEDLIITSSVWGTGGSARIEVLAMDPFTGPEKGTRTVGELKIENVDSKPWIGENPGLITLEEDQNTPTRIELTDWIVDPDSDLSSIDIAVTSSDRRLVSYISYYGSKRYLFVQPTEDLSGDATVWLEIVSGETVLTDKLKIRINPVNDIPKVIMDDVEYQDGQGWLLSGRVEDPDDIGGKIQYRIGEGKWRDAWGFATWSILVGESMVPSSGQYVFIRAHDGLEYSNMEFTKLLWPYVPPVIDDDDNDDPPGDPEPGNGDDRPNDAITPQDPDGSDPPWLLLGGISGVAAGAIIFLLWSEVGFVSMLTAGMSIYSKLSKKDILNHEIRGLIRGYIIANPGDHYSSIKRNLDLNNGTLAYHLRVLEQNGFVKSMFDGIYKRYYPANINISKLKKNVSKQEEIFNMILEHPGVTMEQIGRLIGVSRQVVNYHVKNLIRAGVVDYKRDNKSARFYPVDGVNIGEQT
jgi:DNA-binding transcriptional ArsR family regulator